MFYRDNAALLCLFSHVSSCFHDRPSDNPHMLHSNKTSQFLLLASLPWQPDSFLEPTFLLAYLTQSRGRRPKKEVDKERLEFGQRLKATRKFAGLTIEQLASQVRKTNGSSMSFSSIQMYESGATYPPEHIMAQLVQILGSGILEKAQEAVTQCS